VEPTGGDLRKRARLPSTAAIVVLLCGAFLASFASPSTARVVEPVVAQNLPAITEHTARGGGTAMGDVGCASVCSELWTQEQLNPSLQLVREQVGLRQRVGVFPKLSLLGRVSLVGTTFVAGVWIGDLANDKFFRFNKPAAPASPNFSSFELVYLSQGTYLGDGSYAPETTFYLEAGPYNTKAFKRWTGASSGACSDLDPHPDLGTFTDHLVGADGCAAEQGLAYRELHAYTFPQERLTPAAPLNDYAGEPYEHRIGDWPGEPQTRAELETRTRAALESGDFTLTEAWWANQFDPKNHDEATDEDEDCGLPDNTGGEDPGLGRGTGDTGEEFLRRYERAPSDVYPATGLPSSLGAVYLNWGWSSPNVDNSHIEWRGWGYRKIKAKHGWTSADLEATRQALLSAPISNPSVEGRYDYIGDEYPGRNSARCVRVVVVEYERSQHEVENGAPWSAGIITSFGKRVA
jgi:hypothetical protein